MFVSNVRIRPHKAHLEIYCSLPVISHRFNLWVGEGHCPVDWVCLLNSQIRPRKRVIMLLSLIFNSRQGCLQILLERDMAFKQGSVKIPQPGKNHSVLPIVSIHLSSATLNYLLCLNNRGISRGGNEEVRQDQIIFPPNGQDLAFSPQMVRIQIKFAQNFGFNI